MLLFCQKKMNFEFIFPKKMKNKFELIFDFFFRFFVVDAH